jgi:Secretion system C-terminal sorting domain
MIMVFLPFITKAQLLPDSLKNGASIGGFFDVVFGLDGKPYKLSSLKLPNANGETPNMSGSKLSSKFICSGNSYFELWFEQDWNGIAPNQLTPAQTTLAQATICKVFEDLSAFITRPSGSTDKVQIWIRDLTQIVPGNLATSSVRGAATNFSYVPWDCPTKSGIADNLIWLTINGGKEGFTNIAGSLVTNAQTNSQASGYFHGMFGMNFSNPTGAPWNLSHTANPNTWTSSTDLYSVVLHEMLHCLGFQSNINANGTSVFRGPINNNNPSFDYFTRYDLNLQNSATASPANAKLLSTPLSGQTIPNLIYQNAYTLTPAAINGTCTNTGTQTNNSVSCTNTVNYNTSAVPNMPVYRPICFEPGSLSHFEDECFSNCGTGGTSNCEDIFFTMSNGIDNGVPKRDLKNLERKALADIGYTVNTSFGSGTTWNGTAWVATTYTGTAISGVKVVGYCDGVASGAYSYSCNAGSSASPISINSIIANDVNVTGTGTLGINATSVEVMNSAGSTVSVTGGNINFTASSTASGVVLIRYIPIVTIGTTIFSGNITYLYILINGNCPLSPCNLVTDGGFENVPTGVPCNQWAGLGVNFSNCWSTLFIGGNNGSNCLSYSNGEFNTLSVASTCTYPFLQLPQITSAGATITLPPPPNVSIPNNTIFQFRTSICPNPIGEYNSAIQTKLSTPLIPGNFYTIQFKILLVKETSFGNNFPVYLNVGGATSNIIPQYSASFFINSNIKHISSDLENVPFNLIGLSSGWQSKSITFQYTASAIPLDYLDLGFSTMNSNNMTTYGSIDILIDDIELTPSTNITFTPPTTATCANNIINLAQYLTPTPSGTVTFSGNVAISVYQSGGQWIFNPSLAGNGNSIVTATYTDANGCIVNASANIMVSNTFSFTLAPSSCVFVGGVATLTASGAPSGATFVWKNSANTTISTTSTATINVAGTYSCTVTSGSCSITSTITFLNALPTLMLNQTGCLPGNITIYASSTATVTPTTYSLNNGTPQASGTFTNVTSPGTYTVTVTSGSSACTATSTIVVNGVFTASITATTPSCALATLTALPSGQTYNWQVGLGNTQSIQVASSGTYSVLVTNAQNCTSMATITISNGVLNPCTAGIALPASITSNVGSSPVGFTFTSNTTINNNVTFSGSDIGIRSGATITVMPPFTLTINNSHLRGCSGMWQGIIVRPGARLVINNSLIEDAIEAVFMDNHTVTTNVLTVTGSIFNKNARSIKITNHVAAIVPATYVINSTVFCSRILPLTCAVLPTPNWQSSTVLRAATAQTNDLNTPFKLQNTANAFLVPTLHIDLLNVGNTTGAAPFTFNSMRIGDPALATNFNLFDGGNNGIFANQSNVEFFNNTLQNMSKYFKVFLGYAIKATNDNVANTFTVRRYKLATSFTDTNIVNRFFNNFMNISAFQYTNLDIQRCDMRSVTPGFGTGISIATTQNNNSSILKNKIFNLRQGIGYYYPMGIVPVASLGNVLIQNNIINRINVTNTAANFTALGIEAAVTMASGSSLSTLSTINIDANKLNGVYHGIDISGLNMPNMLSIAQNNDITLLPDPNAAIPSWGGTYAGIRSSINGSNFTHTILANTVRGIANTNTLANSRVVNFELTGNTNSNIRCNRSVTGYSGFTFRGTHTNTVWRNSITNDATSSHWYIFNLAGNIGDQGTLTTCHDNNFGTINGATGSGHTNVSAPFTACNNRIFTRPISGGTVFIPATNQGFNNVNYNNSTCPGVALPATSPVPTLSTCTPPPPLPVAPSGTPSASSQAQMNAIALNQITYTTNQALNKWLADHTLYHTLANDIASRNANATLSAFYNTGATTNIKNLIAIEDLLTQGNTSAANALLGGIVPINIPEQNYKNFYGAYINYINNTLTTTDNETIRNLALGCPGNNGLVVFNARVMDRILNPEVLTFYANNCPGTSNKKEDTEITEQSNQTDIYTVYPNPASNGFYIKALEPQGTIHIKVVDLQGKIVLSQTCTLGDKPCFVAANLVNGIYIVNIVNNETNTKYHTKLEINN